MSGRLLGLSHAQGRMRYTWLLRPAGSARCTAKQQSCWDGSWTVGPPLALSSTPQLH